MKARTKEKLIENIIELSNSVSENVKQDLLDYWKTKQLYMKNGVFCLENDTKTTNDMIFELQEETECLKKIIGKALSKINNMFELADESKIIDDLLELEKILKGSNNK